MELADDIGAPVVAFNGQNWLAVYVDNTAFPSIVVGKLVDRSGIILGQGAISIGPFEEASASPTEQSAPPTTATNGDGWLVSWAYYDTESSQAIIVGARLDGAGNVLDATPLTLGNSATNVKHMLSSRYGSGWLVAWDNFIGEESAVVVGADGAVTSPPFSLGTSKGGVSEPTPLTLAPGDQGKLLFAHEELAPGAGPIHVKFSILGADCSRLDPGPPCGLPPEWTESDAGGAGGQAGGDTDGYARRARRRHRRQPKQRSRRHPEQRGRWHTQRRRR